MRKLVLLFVAFMLFGFTIKAQVDLQNGLVAYYPFNGNANDLSGNNNNGTINGATLTRDRFGNANSAFEFNGTSWIEIPNFSISIPSVTVAAWVYCTLNNDPANNPQILGIFPNSNEHIMQLEISYNNYVYFNSLPHGATNSSDNLFSKNNWHLIIGTYNGTNENVYLDGIKVAETQRSGSYNVISQNIQIGRQINPTLCYWNGIIDDIRIYNRAISEQEIQALYKEGICYQSVTVTDTLIINANLTGFNPIEFKNSIKVYPNPTKQVLNIDSGSNFDTMKDYTLKIINSLSQTVYTTTISQQKTSVNCL